MIRKSHITLLAASLLMVGACSKNNSIKNAQPNGDAMQPTSAATVTALEGTWQGACVPDGDFFSSPEIHTITIKGNLLTEVVTNYSDSSCTQASGSPAIYQSHFTVDPGGATSYTLTYTDGAFSGAQENAQLGDSDSTLTLSSEPTYFIIQK